MSLVFLYRRYVFTENDIFKIISVEIRGKVNLRICENAKSKYSPF